MWVFHKHLICNSLSYVLLINGNKSAPQSRPRPPLSIYLSVGFSLSLCFSLPVYLSLHLSFCPPPPSDGQAAPPILVNCERERGEGGRRRAGRLGLPEHLLGLKAWTDSEKIMSARPGFYRQELNKTVWEVPERYQNLTPVGSGAYGSVWWVEIRQGVKRLCGPHQQNMILFQKRAPSHPRGWGRGCGGRAIQRGKLGYRLADQLGSGFSQWCPSPSPSVELTGPGVFTSGPSCLVIRDRLLSNRYDSSDTTTSPHEYASEF